MTVVTDWSDAPPGHNRAHLVLCVVVLGIAYASAAWTRLNIAIILPEVMQGIGVTSLAIGGILSTISLLGTGCAEPILGHVSDRAGRRLALTLGLGGFSLFSLLTAIAQNAPEMVGIRLLLGIGQGLFIPAYLAFVGGTFERRRGFFIEALVGMFTIGAALNPLLTRALFDGFGGSWQAPSVIYGLFGMALAIVVYALGSGGVYDRSSATRMAAAAGPAGAPAPAGSPFLDRGMALLVITLAGWGLSQYAYQGLYVTYLRETQHFALDQAALVASAATWLSLAGAFLIGWISDQIGRRKTMLITGGITALVGYPLFTITSSFWPAMILGGLFITCNGSIFGLGVAYAQDMGGADKLGGRSGIVLGVGHIMSGLAGGVAAWIASTFGGFQWVGLEVTVVGGVIVACIAFTTDRAHAARMAEQRAARLGPALP